MRIVHVSDCYLPRVGGIENQVQGLAVQQSAHGDAVHVVTATALARNDAPAGVNRYRTTTTDDPAVRVHRMATPTTMGLPIHPRGYWLIRRALQRLRPDVVHVHAGMISPFAWDGAQAARFLGLPLVVTWHSMLDGAQAVLQAGAQVTGWDRATFVPTAVSSAAADRVARVVGRDDVRVIPNGVDLKPWRAAAQSRVSRPHGGPLRMVATQRLASRKRGLALIDIVAEVHSAMGRDPDGHPRIRLTLVGEGPERSRLESMIRSHHLGDVVTLMGAVPRVVLPTLYRDQDVFVAPATLEAFGLAALEARAAGLAVLGRAGTGLVDFLDGASGALADSDAGVAAALVRWARRPELLAEVIDHNVRLPPEQDWNRVLAGTKAAYTQAAPL